MQQTKIYFLTSEVAPFSNTYDLSVFSQKVCKILHDYEDIEIRLAQPKYGYISERKYILREVIRLKDMMIDFNQVEELVNMKSAFIPHSRVQIYFTESDSHFKPLSELIYKSKNGRVVSNIDLRFALFSQICIESLKSLFWVPDVLVCNDWQTAFVPLLLKEKFQSDEFYKKIKTVFILHSLNDLRNINPSCYSSLGIELGTKAKSIDNIELAFKHSDLIVITNKKLLSEVKRRATLSKLINKNNCITLDIGPKSEKDEWKEASEAIYSKLKKL